MDDKGQLMEELRTRMSDVEPLPGEEDFFSSNETLMRFLKARDWKLKEAEKLLRATVEWRRKVNPLSLDCKCCHTKPGAHAIRQIGHDEMGRPVLYSCFAQSAVNKNLLDDTITHSTYLVENAKRTMNIGISTWVMIIDCTGVTLPACNPKLGYGSTQVLSNYYPERLGMVICLNHNALFQGVWKAIKVFLHPNTVAKMKLVRSKKKIRELFDKTFSEELTEWLLEEIKLNKQSPLPVSQKEFWTAPKSSDAHDPRGAPSYVRQHIDTFHEDPKDLTTHRPHPNIVTALRGDLKVASNNTDESQASGNANGEECLDSDEEFVDIDMEIDDEFQIPKDAAPIQM